MKNFRWLLGLFLLLTLAFFLNSNAIANNDAYQVLDHAQLKTMVDDDERNFLLVDARNPEEFKEAHIPGSINIPQKKMENFLGLLPTDKTTQIIYYCNGVKCGKSKKAATKAIELGYTNVWVYSEGMPVWEEMGYSFYKGNDYEKRIETTKVIPSELQKIMEAEADSITVVDVRDAEEFAEGHIPGAINLPLKNFAVNSGGLDKKKKIVVYCNSGGRSYGAYKKLMKLGYKNIYQAIFADWKAQGLSVSM
ncbi:MAG: rhodanese-like domain-containing protein [Desulfocapsa sp.]|nr:rhodanese-like domain-containing protein [Desulfocapsa sp.]